MKCEICGKKKAKSFYHKQNLCLQCFKEKLEQDKSKRRLILISKKKGEKEK